MKSTQMNIRDLTLLRDEEILKLTAEQMKLSQLQRRIAESSDPLLLEHSINLFHEIRLTANERLELIDMLDQTLTLQFQTEMEKTRQSRTHTEIKTLEIQQSLLDKTKQLNQLSTKL